MTEKDSIRRVLILGTGHEYQRHQDQVAATEEIRSRFEKLIREALTERTIELIAEEAGDDVQVWTALKEQQTKDLATFGNLLQGSEVVNAPIQTIARGVASECHIPYIDIRSQRADTMTISERDVAMCESILASINAMTSLLVIVGANHQAGVARLLTDAGFTVDVESFPR
jgi:pheromone shutdown protein TraB